MGVEPTGDAEGRRPTVLKTAPATGRDVLPESAPQWDPPLVYGAHLLTVYATGGLDASLLYACIFSVGREMGGMPTGSQRQRRGPRRFQIPSSAGATF